MASLLRICYINHIDNAIVAAAHEIDSLPAVHLKDQDIQKVWRDTSNSNTHLRADLGQPSLIGLVALINTNLLAVDGVRVRVSSEDPTGATGDVYDISGIAPTTVDSTHGVFIHFIEPAVIGRYVRIDLFNLVDTPEAGRWVVGPTWTPSHNFSFGWGYGAVDHSRRSESLSKNVFVDRLQRQRVWRFALRGLTQVEADTEVADLNRIAGSSQDILLCRDKSSTLIGLVSVWGLLDEAFTVEQVAPGLFEGEGTIRERM